MAKFVFLFSILFAASAAKDTKTQVNFSFYQEYFKRSRYKTMLVKVIQL
jgi:hypothetical protein